MTASMCGRPPLSQYLFTTMHTKSMVNMSRDLLPDKQAINFPEARAITMGHHYHDKPVASFLAVASRV